MISNYLVIQRLCNFEFPFQTIGLRPLSAHYLSLHTNTYSSNKSTSNNLKPDPSSNTFKSKDLALDLSAFQTNEPDC